jgi:hypothetical protein
MQQNVSLPPPPTTRKSVRLQSSHNKSGPGQLPENDGEQGNKQREGLGNVGNLMEKTAGNHLVVGEETIPKETQQETIPEANIPQKTNSHTQKEVWEMSIDDLTKFIDLRIASALAQDASVVKKHHLWQEHQKQISTLSSKPNKTVKQDVRPGRIFPTPRASSSDSSVVGEPGAPAQGVAEQGGEEVQMVRVPAIASTLVQKLVRQAGLG